MGGSQVLVQIKSDYLCIICNIHVVCVRMRRWEARLVPAAGGLLAGLCVRRRRGNYYPDLNDSCAAPGSVSGLCLAVVYAVCPAHTWVSPCRRAARRAPRPQRAPALPPELESVPPCYGRSTLDRGFRWFSYIQWPGLQGCHYKIAGHSSQKATGTLRIMIKMIENSHYL